MASPKTTPPAKSPDGPRTHVGAGGETHQTTTVAEQILTTDQGIPISDDQNSLKQGARGPTLLEDFVLREKITHFDHERIPERIVHARGSGAHGYFQPTKSCAHLTKAAFLQDPNKKTPVFVRFSTVAGGAGSVDLPRDVRGFAVKFYTEEGNFDLVGNNIPVFFIQDAMKFPDLVHSVKMEPDRAFPQAASAHDTFWDFVSLMPESMHMLCWAMSDRGIPRSLRMIEGFGVNTFRFIDAREKAVFVKFHWRPKLGASFVAWDEAVKINGADNDFHRRDLWEAIDSGNFPEWEFAVQVFDESVFAEAGFDILDATKVIPEELVPLEVIGKLVLDRNPDNFFAETEQVAFCPANMVPGIDFSNDPLLQGRIFSYLDTQLSRLGSPNFHEIPINRPKCPMRNFQRDGHMRMEVNKGRVNYEPNTLGEGSTPRESPTRGFASVQEVNEGEKVRARSETFADHYSQARLFFRSMTPIEQHHIMNAFAFELGKVETIAIRKRMLGHLAIIDSPLGDGVAKRLGMEGEADMIKPARAPIDLPLSPTLSLVKKAQQTIEGRKVGCLVTGGADADVLASLKLAVEAAGAKLEIVAPKVAGLKDSSGALIAVKHSLGGAPSVVFDAVAVVCSEEGGAALVADHRAVGWVSDAFNHCKAIGYVDGAVPLLSKAGVTEDAGVGKLTGSDDATVFVEAAKTGRYWERELSGAPKV